MWDVHSGQYNMIRSRVYNVFQVPVENTSNNTCNNTVSLSRHLKIIGWIQWFTLGVSPLFLQAQDWESPTRNESNFQLQKILYVLINIIQRAELATDMPSYGPFTQRKQFVSLMRNRTAKATSLLLLCYEWVCTHFSRSDVVFAFCYRPLNIVFSSSPNCVHKSYVVETPKYMCD